MPQLAKGGKYVYGWLRIHDDFSINIPDEILNEYQITNNSTIYIMTGSKSTGGFCILPKMLLENSKISAILKENTDLLNCSNNEQTYIKYKGRYYSWSMVRDKKIILNQTTLNQCDVNVGNKLLAIRSSDIAFTLGLFGPLIEYANNYSGSINLY